jgi:hypothetical protein
VALVVTLGGLALGRDPQPDEEARLLAGRHA